ncbi:MAG TPA: lysophospholipid acyltransferase family protein [Hyphomicrobiales bacterium]|nr:lysophospholipid acyltransferase family protein [Hyphomicrobiales bacterium]
MQAARALTLSVALVAMTLPCIVIQCLLSALRLPAARSFPMRYHRAFLRIMGVRVHCRGNLDTSGPLLLVANHSSWLDIPVISSRTPLTFVAKKEVESWPIFGLFARLQRSIFVDRTRRRGAHQAHGELARRLSGGEAVVLFAEGTSSDGNRILPFKSALVGAALQAMRENSLETVRVCPLAVTYTHVHGLPIGRVLRTRYAWYGDMELMPHMWDVLRHGPVDVTVSVGPVQNLSRFADRKELSRALECEVRSMFIAELRGGANETAGGTAYPLPGA